jgi:hypothetical protein
MTSSFSGRDMLEQPFTVGELVKLLSEYPQDDTFHFVGEDDELVFFRFKYRGEKTLTMELRDPRLFERADSN